MTVADRVTDHVHSGGSRYRKEMRKGLTLSWVAQVHLPTLEAN